MQLLSRLRLTAPSCFKLRPGKAMRMAREKSLLSLSKEERPKDVDRAPGGDSKMHLPSLTAPRSE